MIFPLDKAIITCTSNLVKWWTGVVWIIVMFLIRCLDSHSDGTHSLQSIHCWTSDVMLHFSKSDEETNNFLNGLRISTFSANVHFWVNFSFNVNLKLCFDHHRDPYVVALRSVTVATVPPDENSIRSEVKCAGFLVHQIGYSACKVPDIPPEAE